MTSNFCVLILLLSLVCYATLGGHNENGMSAEGPNTDTIMEEIELFLEEPDMGFETEIVEETDYIHSCPTTEVEEIVENLETPMDCECRKPKLIRSMVAKPCPKVKPVVQCPYSSAMDEEMEQADCTPRTSKPRIIKRTIRRVIPSTKYNAKEPEAETCNSPVESREEMIEKPIKENEPKHQVEKQPIVEVVEEASVKLTEKVKQKSSKQVDQKAKPKTKQQKRKGQKSNANKPKSNKSKL